MCGRSNTSRRGARGRNPSLFVIPSTLQARRELCSRRFQLLCSGAELLNSGGVPGIPANSPFFVRCSGFGASLRQCRDVLPRVRNAPFCHTRTLSRCVRPAVVERESGYPGPSLDLDSQLKHLGMTGTASFGNDTTVYCHTHTS